LQDVPIPLGCSFDFNDFQLWKFMW